jgi:hypothetical protein
MRRSIAVAKESERRAFRCANDNDSRSGEALDPRILRIAEAIGRQLARERIKPTADDDNQPSAR